MRKKELAAKGPDFKKTAKAVLVGVVVCVAAMLCMALLIEKGILPEGKWGIVSCVALCIGSGSASVYLILRQNKNILPSALAASAIMLLLVVCLAMLCCGHKLDAFAVLVDFVLIVAVSLICTMVAGRTGFSRKRRKKSIR